MRSKLNLTIDPEVARVARDLGLNMSKIAEAAIARASKVERNRRWMEANKAALDAYAEEVARHGLPLERHRTF